MKGSSWEAYPASILGQFISSAMAIPAIERMEKIPGKVGFKTGCGKLPQVVQGYNGALRQARNRMVAAEMTNGQLFQECVLKRHGHQRADTGIVEIKRSAVRFQN
jgi:hypothetical protein